MKRAANMFTLLALANIVLIFLPHKPGTEIWGRSIQAVLVVTFSTLAWRRFRAIR